MHRIDQLKAELEELRMALDEDHQFNPKLTEIRNQISAKQHELNLLERSLAVLNIG